jgi:hypothetical protein
MNNNLKANFSEVLTEISKHSDELSFHNSVKRETFLGGHVEQVKVKINAFTRSYDRLGLTPWSVY